MSDFKKGFKKGMNTFGQTIAIIVNSILLTIVYFVGVGMAFLFTKFTKKKFLDLKPNKNAKTYWVDLNLKKRPIEEHYRQF